MKQSALKVDPAKTRAWQQRSAAKSRPKRQAISPASLKQREKVKDQPCANCGGVHCDPAHLTSRAQGGCDDPACVIALCRICHDRLDGRLPHSSELDLAAVLALPQFAVERAHMASHLSFPAALQRLTGERWAPQERVT